ncbi:hypothetical protein D3C78_884270 [compost metagenome]
MAFNAWPTVTPSASVLARVSSRVNFSANTPEPIMHGAKRDPSSLVQTTTSSGASVSTPRSLSVRSTSTPASTPKQPSNLPPVGWVSMWLPVITGGNAGLRPARRAKMLPTPSMLTVQPASSHQVTNRSRAWRSRSVNARRQTPPLTVAPSRASSMSDCHKRSRLMCWWLDCRTSTAAFMIISSGVLLLAHTGVFTVTACAPPIEHSP